jgi:hypothetical protein
MRLEMRATLLAQTPGAAAKFRCETLQEIEASLE